MNIHAFIRNQTVIVNLVTSELYTCGRGVLADVHYYTWYMLIFWGLCQFLKLVSNPDMLVLEVSYIY